MEKGAERWRTFQGFVFFFQVCHVTSFLYGTHEKQKSGSAQSGQKPHFTHRHLPSFEAERRREEKGEAVVKGTKIQMSCFRPCMLAERRGGKLNPPRGIIPN